MDESLRRCAYNDHGFICNDLAHMTLSVTGAGPWYCRKHFARVMGWEPWAVAEKTEDMAAIDERVNKIVPRLPGESEHDWSMRCRTYVLETVRKLARRMREPGEDQREAA